MTRIQRYVLREFLGPTVIGTLAYGLILTTNLSMHAAEMMIRRDLPASLVAQFVGLALPRIAVLTLPMAVLLGILVGTGRLVSDNELGALRSLGYNERRLIVPALILGLLATAVTWFLFDTAVPIANYAQHQLQARIFISSDLNREILPRTFYEKIPGLLIYADETNPSDGTLQRVLIHQKAEGGREEISTSRRARIEYRDTDGVLNFRLEDVVSHTWDRADPHVYQVASRDEESIVRPPDIFTTEMLRTLEKPPPPNLREQNMFQLLETIRGFKSMEPGAVRRRFRNEAWVEFHKKISLPVTCLVFAFLALPLGLAQRRGGRAWGFLISLLVVAVQYYLLTTGEQTADRGRIPPWLAMWMGNLVFLAVGAFLLLFGSRWSWDPAALLSRFSLRDRSGRARAARSRAEASNPSHADLPPAPPRDPAVPAPAGAATRPRAEAAADRPPWRRRLLPVVDVYLFRTLAFAGGIVALSLTLLFALYASVDLIDDMTRGKASPGLLLQYLANVLPQFVTSYVLPMSLCAATLITFALLARTHELTALRSAGVGPFRVSWIFLLTGALAAAASFGALDSVLPATNQKAIELRDKIRGRSPRSYRQTERRWVFGSHGDLVTFSSLRPERGEILELTLMRFRPNSLRILERIFAERAQWHEGSGWELIRGWRREFADEGENYEEFEQRFDEGLDPPPYFSQEWKAPDQMNIGELRAHVLDLQRRGYDTREIRVGLHRKIAVPAICVVMVLIALPFGLRIEKRGPLFGLGIALLIAAVYFFLMQMSGKLGEIGVMPPVLAAWSPNLLFSGAGLYLMASSRW